MPIDPFKDTPNLFELIGQDEQLKEAGQSIEDFLKGAILGNTTDLVGAPVQILGDALNALGVPVGTKPVGGTNWLREQLGQAQPENESLAQTLGSLVGMPDPQSAVALGGIMMGPKSKLWNKDAQEYLEAFEQAGFGKDKDALRQIFEQLNVYRGVDGKTRQEIPDFPAQMKIDGTAKPARSSLADVLDHPELFQAYPKLADLPVILSPKAADDGSAMFASGGLFTGPYIEFNPNSSTAKTDLLHEIQHAIQKTENFAKGGNSAQFEGSAELKKAREYFKQIAPKNAGNLSDEALQMMLYRRLAGETEARLVEDRALLPPEMLRTTFPPDVYSVPAENQILNFYKKP